MYLKTRKRLIIKPAQIASPNMLLQEYQGIGERHPQPVAQMGRSSPSETPVMLVKAVPFISDQLRMVPKMFLTITMFHPMARRDIYSDRNVQESSAEDVQPDKEASMNNLQEA